MPLASAVCFSAFAQVAPVLAVFDYVADGHGPSEKSARDLGVGGTASWCRRWFEVGVSVRYDFADGGVNAHFVTAPVWIGARLPVNDAPVIRFTAAVGPGLGFVAGFPDDSSTLVTLGATTEAAIGLLYQTSPDLAIAVELGARFDSLREINTDDDYLDGGTLAHGQLPFLRAGASW